MAHHFYTKGLFTGITSFSEFEKRLSSFTRKDNADVEKYRNDAFEVFIEAYLNTHSNHLQVCKVWAGASNIPDHIREKLRIPKNTKAISGVFSTAAGEYCGYKAVFQEMGKDSLSQMGCFFDQTDLCDSRIVLTNGTDVSKTLGQERSWTVKGPDFEEVITEGSFERIRKWLENGCTITEPRGERIYRPGQKEAVEDVVNTLSTHSRAQLIMACGTGKTLIGIWAAEEVKARTILVLVPSLALMRQTVHEWIKHTPQNFARICVCSDNSIGKLSGEDNNEEITILPSDLNFPITTDSEVINGFLAADTETVRVVFSTYQSAMKVGDGLPNGFSFDFAVFDEAHKTAGFEGAEFSFALEDKNISCKKRLFMTATACKHSSSIRDEKGNAKLIYSMDNEAMYGPVAHRLTFRQALDLGIICDYKVVVSVIKPSDLAAADDYISKQGQLVKISRVSLENAHVAGTDSRALTVAKQIALKAAIEKYGISKVVSFHESVKAAKAFTGPGQEGIGRHLTNFLTAHVNGSMSIKDRSDILSSLKDEAGSPTKRSFVSNARCLTEGVDIPAVDMVAFMSPKKSAVDIIQAAGRVMRIVPGKTVGYIFVPIFVNNAEGEDAEAAINESSFKDICYILMALMDYDRDFYDTVKNLRSQRSGKPPEKLIESFRDKCELSIPLGRLFDTISSEIIEKVPLAANTWDYMYGQFLEFKAKNGHCDVLRSNCENKQLAQWVCTQRDRLDRGTITEVEIAKLNEAGMIWTRVDTRWADRYNELCEYYKVHGQTSISYDEKHIQLRNWVTIQRVWYKQEILDPPRIDLLNKINFDWCPVKSIWEKRYEELLDFHKANGHPNVPVDYENKQLSRWVRAQREQESRKTLEPDRFQLLDKLGLTWVTPSEEREKIRSWGTLYQQLKDFVAENGHAKVPFRYMKNLRLARWVTEQRRKQLKGSLGQKEIDLLNEIGFVWGEPVMGWDHWYSELKKLKDELGEMPKSFANQDYLGSWVSAQRTLYSEGRLTPDREKLLNDIGFDWRVRLPWEVWYKRVQEFVTLNGHCNLSEEASKDRQLRNWIGVQRNNYKKGILLPERQALLDQIGFPWPKK